MVAVRPQGEIPTRTHQNPPEPIKEFSEISEVRDLHSLLKFLKLLKLTTLLNLFCGFLVSSFEFLWVFASSCGEGEFLLSF